MSPTVVMSIVAVTTFVAVILVMVLLLNGGFGESKAKKEQSTAASSPVILEDEEEASEETTKVGVLTPDDLDFWDMYPEQEESEEPESEEEAVQETVESDPASDGKHTLIQYADGEEEWVLISPYLPKNEYDFTKLVCQSDIMKYYVNGKQVSYTGVDISKLQDYVDFVKVKKAGIDFVMLRVGVRGYGTGQLLLDDYFSDNLKRATDAGLEVGVYFSSQAITKEEAVEEANMVLENLGEYRISYPVAFDMESVENDTARTDALSRSEKTDIAKAFLDTISAAGYKTIIYGNKEWLIKQIDMSKLTAYDVWLSQQTDIPDYPYQFTMWQYSQQGSVDGIAGYADMNISFIDYSEK
jgi:GH25 family lysozyme M1 (1,4-beta-N-acetylmuramidase)